MSSASERGPSSARERPLRRARRAWRTIRLPLLGLLLVISLVLGYIGFSDCAEATGEALSASDVLYLTLQLAALDSGAVAGPIGWELEAARWLMPAVAAYTARGNEPWPPYTFNTQRFSAPGPLQRFVKWHEAWCTSLWNDNIRWMLLGKLSGGDR